MEILARVQGVELAVRRRDVNADDGAQDPFFFDQDYSVAAATGQLMWEGSWALVQLLQDQESWLANRLANGTRTLELGAGIGLLGLSAAAAGAHVLLTDLPSIVEASLEPNLRANAPDGRVGAGSVMAAPLDWRRPLHMQHAAAEFAETAQVVLAAECVCMSSERIPTAAKPSSLLPAPLPSSAGLRELVPPFVELVCQLLLRPKCECGILTLRERSKGGGAFTSCEEVLAELRVAGVECSYRGAVDPDEARGRPSQIYEMRRGPSLEGRRSPTAQSK